MFLLNQPFDGQLGKILIEQMEKDYKRFIILSAFAKNSGVLRIKPAMKRFIDKGGKIDAYIGIDSYGTSYEALLNLFHTCDNLYIIHSESSTTTFHSKIYTFTNDEVSWIAVGSNNLTGGGLWTNFESAILREVEKQNTSEAHIIKSFLNLLDIYDDDEYKCSKKIESENDLIELLNMDYIRNENRIHTDDFNRNKIAREDGSFTRQFGTHTGIKIPQLQEEKRDKPEISQREVIILSEDDETYSSNNEKVWFETKAMTGGSRNILDLSKLGKIYFGTKYNKKYESGDKDYILGGVAFFDIDPNSTSIEKDITVNYNGHDYFPCTIKFAPDNGSWRIQLKGKNPSGKKLHNVGGINWLMHKIIIFEKIRTDFYAITIESEGSLKALMDQSNVIAHNGISSSSKLYGFI